MDANGTRYHLLLGRPDWGACADRARGPDGAPVPALGDVWETAPKSTTTAWNDETQDLTLRPRLARFAPPVGLRLRPEDRRGAARDRFGNWYWIAPGGTDLLVNSVGTAKTTHFWSAADSTGCVPVVADEFRPVTPPTTPAPRNLRGLAVTADHYLVVGTVGPGGLFVFDLHSGGPPREIVWPADVPFAPFDLAPRPCGGVWVLDRANHRYWALDRHLRPSAPGQVEVLVPGPPDDFRPEAECAIPLPAVRSACPGGFDLAAASPLDVDDPISIEGLPDDTVLVLDQNLGQGVARVVRYRYAVPLGTPVALDGPAAFLDLDEGPAFTLTAHDFAFVPEHTNPDGAVVPDRLYVVGDDGIQGFAFDVRQEAGRLVLGARADYLPLRLFGGKALVAVPGGAYYDFADRWVPLVAQRRPRYAAEGEVFTPLPLGDEDTRPPFDGRDPGCVWHRLMLDACLPPETAVRVYSRAADEPAELAHAAWVEEPPLYRRCDGSELPFADVGPDGHHATWELLFQRARGRFLQLRLALSGNGKATPRIRALRAYYPRFSYLNRYLPAVYREDAVSASFLDRFLANPEGLFTATEDRVAAVQLLFDPASAPAAALPWLARWFDLALDPSWDEGRRRLVLKNALKLFQYRGTRRGLETALHLAFDACADERLFADPSPADRCARRPRTIRVVEHFRTRRVGTTAGRWKPADGSAALHTRCSSALGGTGPVQEFPLQGPTGGEAAWTAFALSALGFVPAAGAGDLARWQDFLARRYGRIAELNTAHGSEWNSFTDVPLFAALPDRPGPLRDWYEFDSVVVAAARAAHRFTVLLPAPRTDAPDRAEARRRLDLARRVIDQEKPAHTGYDVQFYWSYFRVGAARLGEDSVIDRGSRAAELHPPAVLGEEYVGGSFLAAGHPRNVLDRQVLGRDRLGRGRPTDGDDDR